MEREECKIIAKEAYIQIMAAIKRIEKKYPDIEFSFGNRRIWVNDEFFSLSDLE